MEAFVQTRNGEYENVNFYTAARGFYELGYYVNKLEIEAIEKPPAHIDKDTPVYAGIPYFKGILKLLGVNYQEQEAYPAELYAFLHRTVGSILLSDLRSDFLKHKYPVFIRPMDHERKLFNGHVIRSEEDLRTTLHLPEDTVVNVSEEVQFVSEYRVYVLHNEILGVKHYKGDHLIFPSKHAVESMVNVYSAKAPVAYCLDVGVQDTHETSLVEVNDAINMGNYGLPAVHFARMIDARWLEITRS